MTDIICDCGHEANEHDRGCEHISFGVSDCECIASDADILRAHIAKLEAENGVMYAAILEASTLGASAALRCKVELQRIAKNEA